MPSAPVVANNTPLVAFWTIDRLDLLQALYDEVLVPQAVHSEFLAAESLQRRSALRAARWIKPVALKDLRRADTFAGIGRGEAEVMALAQETNARLAIIDDRRARRFALRLHIPLTGTLGVLLAAKQNDLIDTVLPYVSILQAAGIFLSPMLVKTVLLLAGEDAATSTSGG